MERARPAAAVPSSSSSSEFHAPEAGWRPIEDGVTQEMEAAVRFAETSPDPPPQDYRQYIYSEPSRSGILPLHGSVGEHPIRRS